MKRNGKTMPLKNQMFSKNKNPRKFPEIDRGTNFWFRALRSRHKPFGDRLSNVINNPE